MARGRVRARYSIAKWGRESMDAGRGKWRRDAYMYVRVEKHGREMKMEMEMEAVASREVTSVDRAQQRTMR